VTQYIFDANVFMTPHRNKYYHITTHPAFWQMLEQMMIIGTVTSIQEVLKEIQGKGWLKNWVTNQKSYFDKLDGADQLKVAQISAVAQTWMVTNSFDAKDLTDFFRGADPYLLARAWEKGLTLVTYETPYSPYSKTANTHKIKIPDIAKLLNIPCIDLHGFLVNENVKFSSFSTT